MIANGAECEPYITCDDQLMRNYTDEIVGGLKIMLQLFPNAEGVVLIEENKPEAIAAVQKVCANENKIHVHPVHVKYPQGGERAIMDVVAGKHIKLGMLPADVGCVVDNVATVRAIYRAVAKTEPLMERGFTGYNGRLDRKSSGIGLYLCRKAADRLGFVITFDASYKNGTRVVIDMTQRYTKHE